MPAPLLTFLAVYCAACSVLFVELAAPAPAGDFAPARICGRIAACFLAAGVGFLIWSKGA